MILSAVGCEAAGFEAAAALAALAVGLVIARPTICCLAVRLRRLLPLRIPLGREVMI